MALILLVLSVAGCDPGGRLAQLTPQPPAATPMLLGVTAEPPPGATPLAASATPAPLPAATYDPARPAWTILYYGGADNDRANFVWDDLNEMEAAGPSDQVQVVAQVDWPENGPAGTAESVRYLIRPDTDPQRLASEPVAALGEMNHGDPTTLANFLAWGMTAYPANRYALILGDFGNGWQGCCIDEAIGLPGQSDHLSLPDLDQALALARSESGGLRLNVIGFAGGLMSQLDVLQALQPHVDYVAASPGLMPGTGWDFQAVLAQLNGDPLVDGHQFAGDLVTGYVNTQRQLQGDEYVAMAAIDLSRVPALSAAVESLAVAMAADPVVYSAIAREARRGAQVYGAAALADANRIAAVDLLHSAAIIAEVSPPGELQAAASAVVTATGDVLVAYDHGQGVPGGRGIAIYWPATPGTFDPLYAQVSRIPSWAAFLQSRSAPAEQPRLTLEGGAREVVNIAQPALMRAQLTARQVTEVALVADQEAADGRRVLRQYEVVQPAQQTLPGGTSVSLWRDGGHESLIVWDATGSYLYDTTGAGDHVPLWSVDAAPIGAQPAAAGRFRRQDAAADREATATFAPGNPAATHLWTTAIASSGARLLGEVAPAPGDVFQASILFVGPDGALNTEPGVSLTYDDARAIYHSARPLPAGRYAVGLRVEYAGDAPLTATHTVTLDPATAPDGFRAYVDVDNAVQFLYPADWVPPTTQDGVSFTRNISGTAQLQVRTYPGWGGDLAALQTEVLSTFGSVSLLQQEPTFVGVEPRVEGVRTAYGYDSAEQEPRTGAFLTFLANGVGFVVDLDGPRETEATTLAALDIIAGAWQFLPPRLGFGPEPWSTLNVGDFRVQYPTGYAYQEFNNWHRFAADPQTFVAVRIQPAARTPAEAMSGLLQTAAEGVSGFSAEEPQRLFYAGRVWERNDFTYVDTSGNPVYGLLISRQDGDREVAVWGETLDSGRDLLEMVFLPTAASIERIAPPSG